LGEGTGNGHLHPRENRNPWNAVAILAARAQLEPWPWTLRELAAAADRRSRDEWTHTATLAAIIAATIPGNTHTHPRHWYPWPDEWPDPPLTRVPITALRIFLPNGH
jgi:hypothetical protein